MIKTQPISLLKLFLLYHIWCKLHFYKKSNILEWFFDNPNAEIAQCCQKLVVIGHLKYCLRSVTKSIKGTRKLFSPSKKTFSCPTFSKLHKKVLEFSFTTTTNIQFLEIGNLVFCLSNGRNIRYQKLCQKRVKSTVEGLWQSWDFQVLAL